METQEEIGTSLSHPIFANFIPQSEISNLKGALGITFAPGKWQKAQRTGLTWQRDVTLDLTLLKEQYNATTLVTLIERHEFVKLKIENIREKAFELGLNSIWFPITDGSVPDLGNESLTKFDMFISYLHSLLFIGENIIVHCMGGLGRAGTISTCILVKNGKTTNEALYIVRNARKGAVENSYQEEFIQSYENYLKSSKIIN